MTKLIIKSRFGIVPNELLNDENVSLKAKGIFAFLQSKPDGWSFSVERISAQTKDGKDGVRSALQELENAGYLVRRPVKNRYGKWGGYEYELSDKPLTENPTTDKPLTENHDTISKKDNSKKDIVKKSIDNAQSEIERLFDEFWNKYPRKVSKKKAQQIFTSLIKKKTGKMREALFAEIMGGLRKYKNSRQWSDAQYIPHPTTWLNQERWNDDVEIKKREVIKI